LSRNHLDLAVLQLEEEEGG